MTLDLFSRLNPPCGDCAHLGSAIPSGVRYCVGNYVWRWADDRTECGRRSPLMAAQAVHTPSVQDQRSAP